MNRSLRAHYQPWRAIRVRSGGPPARARRTQAGRPFSDPRTVAGALLGAIALVLCALSIPYLAWFFE